MQHAEGAAAVGPDQDHCVLSFGNVGKGLLHVRGGRRLLTVDALDHVARLESRILGRASRLNPLDDRALDVLGRLNLIAYVRGKVGDPDSPTRFAVFGAGRKLFLLVFRAELFQGDRNAHALAVAEDVERDLGPGTLGGHFGLKLSGAVNLLTVEADDDVSDLEASARTGRIRLHFADQGAVGVLQVEELRVLGRHV